MQIAIDARELFHSTKTGKGQWTSKFIEELRKRDVDLILFADKDVQIDWGKRVAIRAFPSGLWWHVRVWRALLTMDHVDVYVSPTSYIVPFLIGRTKKTLLVVHDMIAFQTRRHDRKAMFIERLLAHRTLRQAWKICTVTQSTANDICAQFPDIDRSGLYPIYAGPHSENPPQATSDQRTILCAGTLCPRKNQLRLIHAYAALPTDLRSQFRLVLIGGRGWGDESIVEAAAQTDGVTWKGRVSDVEYESALQSCHIFALPSLYEGFGLQILDALQRGIPVLTARRGSLPEVAGSAALYVDPESIDDIRDGLRQLLTNSSQCKFFREAGPVQARHFSWQRTVDLFLEAVHST